MLLLQKPKNQERKLVEKFSQVAFMIYINALLSVLVI
jgi:hypothetical protein